MTTEIAVSNRLGIALATDSAVTITGGGRVKVFDTADKLFELSDEHPVAAMINGNMDCLGVPWEILVKNFRDKEGRRPRPTIDEWGRDFLSYVEGHGLINEAVLGGYVDSVAISEISAVQGRVNGLLQEFIFNQSDLENHTIKKGNFDVRKMLSETVEKRKGYLESKDVAESLKDVDPARVQDAYGERIRELIVERFRGQKLADEELRALLELVILALLRAIPSDFVAGIVVAGFGEEETFPAVFAAEVDGRVAGKLKVTDLRSDSIATSQDGGQVIYFAQTDVIQRLLKGVDPQFVSRTAEFIERAVTQVAESIEKATRRKRTSAKKIQERLDLIRDVAATVTDEYQSATAENLKDGFSREFDRMIAMMPKQELIELAEALVSITAVERKATTDEGTVGGPIDVAFITKHEGFVWIKRKHYFERDLNARYFWRKYGNPPQRSSP